MYKWKNWSKTDQQHSKLLHKNSLFQVSNTDSCGPLVSCKSYLIHWTKTLKGNVAFYNSLFNQDWRNVLQIFIKKNPNSKDLFWHKTLCLCHYHTQRCHALNWRYWRFFETPDIVFVCLWKESLNWLTTVPPISIINKTNNHLSSQLVEHKERPGHQHEKPADSLPLWKTTYCHKNGHHININSAIAGSMDARSIYRYNWLLAKKVKILIADTWPSQWVGGEGGGAITLPFPQTNKKSESGKTAKHHFLKDGLM